MAISITVRITEEQADKIRKSGINTSEYTRRAIELYSEQKDNASMLSKINIISECINILEEYKKSIQQDMINIAYNELIYKNDEPVSYKKDEKVRQTGENLSYKKEENVSKSYKNDKNVRQFVRQNEEETSYIFDENVRQMKDDQLYSTYNPHLQLLSKMLNLHNSVPDATKKKITDETATKPSELNEFIFNYRDEIKQINYEISNEIVYHDYEDGNEMKKI